MAPGGIVDPLTGLRIDDDDGADPPPSVSHRASSSKPRRRKGKGAPPSGAAPADDDATPSDRGASKGKPARRRGRGRGEDSDSADDDPRGSSVRGVDRVDRGSEGRKRGARRSSSHHAPRPGEVGFEGLDDGGRSQSLYKGMSRVAVKRLLERKAAEAAGDPARAQPPLDVPAVAAGIFDACAHLHLAVRRACDAARVPHTLDDAWRLAERATTRPPSTPSSTPCAMSSPWTRPTAPPPTDPGNDFARDATKITPAPTRPAGRIRTRHLPTRYAWLSGYIPGKPRG